MSDLFLTRQEVIELTDKKKADAQIRWFDQKNFPYEVSARGKPKVLRAVVVARMGGIVENREPQLRLPQ